MDNEYLLKAIAAQRIVDDIALEHNGLNDEQLAEIQDIILEHLDEHFITKPTAFDYGHLSTKAIRDGLYYAENAIADDVYPLSSILPENMYGAIATTLLEVLEERESKLAEGA